MIKNRASILKVLIFSIILSGFCLYSCEKYTYEPPGVNPNKEYSFQNDVLPVFENCQACHPSKAKPDLSAANAYESLAKGGYVNTAKPEESVIIKKLDKGHGGLDKTSPGYFNILGWIIQGAKNN